MKTNHVIKLSLALCLVGLVSTQALAYNSLGADWRDYYPTACEELQEATRNSTNCVMCHTSGFGLNPYGLDYENAGRMFGDIEDLDSDNDGRTNGEEILEDCTLPGDPISPVDSDTWGSIKALFR